VRNQAVHGAAFVFVRNTTVCGLAVFLAASAWLDAGERPSDWPQWRGPLLTGSQPNARNLPARWGPEQNIQWRVELPSWSAATPIVSGDLIFIATAASGFHEARTYRGADSSSPSGTSAKLPAPTPESKKIYLLALDRQTGAERWRREIGDHNRIYRKQNLSTPSPVTDGRWVWTLTGGGRLSAFDRQGQLRWSREIEEDYGPLGLPHGYASSPLLDGDRIFVQVMHAKKSERKAYAFAVDKLTGRTVWKVDRPSLDGLSAADDYSTPTLAAVGGRKQLVLSAGDSVTGHDPATGRELWRHRGFNPQSEDSYRSISSTLAWQEQIFATAARGKPLISFRAGGGALWRSAQPADVPTPATDGKLLYVVSDRGIVRAMDIRSGRTVWGPERLEPGTYSASPLLADGKLIVVNEDAVATVLRAGDGFEVLGVNRLSGHTLSSPAAAGDQLFIRTSEALYAIQSR